MNYKQFLLIGMLCMMNVSVVSQWTHRYCKVDGYRHHVYLEGFELPVLNAGPSDPAPSPDGINIAFVAHGYLWMLNTENQTAQQLTNSGDIDARPNWSPDGKQIVFVRDDGTDTRIMIFDISSGTARTLINTKALELDPIFSKEGKSVIYSSAENGSLDLWSIQIETKERTVISGQSFLERLPVPVDNKWLLYLKKTGFSFDSIELLDLEDGSSTSLIEDNFTSQISFSMSPDGQTMAYTFPHIDDYEIRLKDITVPSSTLMLTSSNGLPLNPKFSSDGQWIYYCENNRKERSEIKKISVNGGEPELVPILQWNWKEDRQKVRIYSRIGNEFKAVRISVKDAKGHPIIPKNGAVRTDGQNGHVFFYCPGVVEVEAPIGEISVKAVHGFESIPFEQTFQVEEKQFNRVEINLQQIWDASENSWYAADNHFHLNYGGVYHLEPDDIRIDLLGEGIDIGFPLLANLHNRFLEQDLWGWENDEIPMIRFGQEVRSHFLGHLGLIGNKELYWPWVWGPYYDVYGQDDRPNAHPLKFTRKQGGLSSYVHPVSVRDPFTEEGMGRIPTSMVADCVLGDVDLIELACLWTDEIGTGALWHEILNLGVPINLSAGSDVMNDYYRTMAIGASRVYVKTDSLTEENYYEALSSGRSFVSTGPLLEFDLGGKEVGEYIKGPAKKVPFTLKVHSPTPYDRVEIFLNGKIAFEKKGIKSSGTKEFSGMIDLPSGGWVTARVWGGEATWPVMDSYPFAETSPIWINEVGSTNHRAQQEAATKLMKALEVAEQDAIEGYGETPIPVILDQFGRAKRKLQRILDGGQN